MQKRPKLPPWIRVKVNCGKNRNEVAGLIDELKLNSVCASAHCPNLGECWHRGTATFMILGDECTRNCKFCAVKHNAHPVPPDPEEVSNLVEAVKRMKLKYVVITCVTRDDLSDGGAIGTEAIDNILFHGQHFSDRVLIVLQHGDHLEVLVDQLLCGLNIGLQTQIDICQYITQPKVFGC